MRIALLDADVTAFASAVVSEKSIDWGDGIWTLHADEDEGRRIFSESVTRIQDKVEADKIILAFSDKENWRKEILPTYKSNRANSRPPILRRALTEWAQQEYECFVRPSLEGDDVLGILSTMKRKGKDEYVICTIDKDLKTIPGLHYNTKHDKFFEVTEEEANRWHLMQTLTGDPTDGYDGCPGIGPVTAKRIIDKDPTWAAVVAAYDKAGLGEEEALVQARVARICRAEDYDFKKKKIILWNPPN